MLVISSSISHDLLKKTLRPDFTERAELLAARHGGVAMQLSDIPANLAAYDIVISSTGSSLPVAS